MVRGIGLVLNLVSQLAMIGLGAAFTVTPDVSTGLLLLVWWCLIGTMYALTAIIVLWVLSTRQPDEAGRIPLFVRNRFVRIVSMLATVLASLVGMGAAIEVLTFKQFPDSVPVVAVGVWAMLLAWGFLQWGFSQLYYGRYYLSTGEPPLRFPATEHPRLVDFVYFGYTVGTSFAVSDVEVRATSMRWRVTIHTVLSFFFNGLIIVLAFNTITSIGN